MICFKEFSALLLVFLFISQECDGAMYNEVNEIDPILKRITVFMPSLAGHLNRTAVLIFPGGAYETLEMEREGSKVAQAFNENNVVAFVVKYTLPNLSKESNSTFSPLIDAQNAVRYVREHAEEFGVNPNKIGVIGFSAGGHLAATLGTHYNFPLIENSKHISLRPDFMALIYPVISFSDSVTHLGSRTNLIGPSPSLELCYFFSNELHVNAQTPITFLTHALDDAIVSPSNSLFFFNSLKNNAVNAKLKLYSIGGHGYLQEPKFTIWFDELLDWMNKNKLL